MATYTPQNAMDLVSKYVRDVPNTSIDSQLCDSINSIIWLYFPWRWAQDSLTAISLTDAVQDHAIDAADTDFFKLLRARIVRTDTTPDTYHELGIRQSLTPDLATTSMYNISSVAWEPITSKFRLSQAIAIASGETYQLQGEYWKNPTLINDAAMATAFSFPDQFFPVFCEGLKWKMYDYVGDQRAGTVIVTKDGRRQFTGQLGVFMALLQQMAEAEDTDGENAIFPDSPLGAREWGASQFVYGS